MPERKVDFTEPIKTATPEVREIIKQVLNLEKERLYENAPRLNEEIANIVRKAIQ